MVATLRLLVLDAYDPAGRAALEGVGAAKAGELYRRMIARLAPTALVDVAVFDGRGFALPEGVSLTSYDGIAWTGSNLTVHRDTPSVRAQLDLAREAFASGVPSFGSCWAVHIAVTASGGRCEANPRGREFGIGRCITLSEAGLVHPMYAEKRVAFDAFTSHEDHVVSVGASTVVLAENEFSPVQAVSVTHGRGTFWAVQYHPEYDLNDVAQLGILRAPQLIAQGFFRSPDDAADYLGSLEALHAEPSRRDLAFRFGIGEALLDEAARTVEVRNWLDRLVLPSVRR
jgi:GMP synthase (glutamine-hydrolysing)